MKRELNDSEPIDNTAKSDTKIAIDSLWKEYDRTTDPARRAQIKEDIADIAGAVGDIPGLEDDDE